MEIKFKYAREECLIQEKEIVRLNAVQEEQENRSKVLHEDLSHFQEQVNVIPLSKHLVLVQSIEGKDGTGM